MSAKDLDSHTLFKRAIMMSIPAAYPALSVATAHDLAEKRTAEWGCSNADKHLEAACLRALPAEIFTDPPIAKRSLFWHSVHDSPLLLVKDTGVFDPLIDTFLAVSNDTHAQCNFDLQSYITIFFNASAGKG
jgi:hypothetical protein